MKTMELTVLLALILLFESKTNADENFDEPRSQSPRLPVADWIAAQFHSYSTELTLRATDIGSIAGDENFAALSDETGLLESLTAQSGSNEVNRSELEFRAHDLTTQMTLRPDTYEARWRKRDLWLVPPRKTEDVVVYKNVEFSGVFAHVTDLFLEPQKFLQLFNPWAPTGYGVAITTRTGVRVWSFGF